MRLVFLFNNPAGSSAYTVSGNVYFWCSGSSGVNAVTMSITGAETKTVYTDSSGAYSFSATASGQYVITPKKHIWIGISNSLITNGCTITDLDYITAIVGNTDSGRTFYHYIAGDVNGSNTLTTADRTTLNSAIGGNAIALNIIRAKNWRFVQTEYSQSGFPPPSWAFPSSHSLAVSSNTSSLDFYAIKVGDLDGTADVTLP